MSFYTPHFYRLDSLFDNVELALLTSYGLTRCTRIAMIPPLLSHSIRRINNNIDCKGQRSETRRSTTFELRGAVLVTDITFSISFL